MANINHIRISGVTYSIEDIGAQQSLSAKQDTLVSGTNIKTINNQSLLGSGNIAIQGGSGATVTEVTQAEYDALVTAGTVDLSTLYIITDATAVDISQYYTSAQTNSAINAAVSGKADSSAVTEEIAAAVSGKLDTSAVTSSVTSASTDSEIPTAKAVYDAVGQGGGGGTTYSGISGITINNNNEIYYDGIYKTWLTSDHSNDKAVYWFRGSNSKIWIDDNTPTTSNSEAGRHQFSFGAGNNLKGSIGGVAFGQMNTVKGFYAVAFGQYNNSNNMEEFTIGQYNVSSSASATFGDSGNTLFSVGNGTSNARHNAFEIRQNGDIYISSGGTDIKLQDNLGGGGIDSGTVQSMIDESISGKLDTSAVTSSVTSASTDSEIPTAKAVNDKLADYQTLLTAGTNITITDNVISAQLEGGTVSRGDVEDMISAATSGLVETSAITSSVTSASTDSEIPTAKAVFDAMSQGGGLDEDKEKLIASALVDLNDRKIDASEVKSNYQRKGDYATKTELAAKANASEVMTLEKAKENELVTAKALNDLNSRIEDNAAALGGLSLVKLTQIQYDALVTKDSNTLYVITE